MIAKNCLMHAIQYDLQSYWFEFLCWLILLRLSNIAFNTVFATSTRIGMKHSMTASTGYKVIVYYL